MEIFLKIKILMKFKTIIMEIILNIQLKNVKIKFNIFFRIFKKIKIILFIFQLVVEKVS